MKIKIPPILPLIKISSTIMICDKDAIKSVDSLPIRANLKNRARLLPGLHDSAELLLAPGGNDDRTVQSAEAVYVTNHLQRATCRKSTEEEGEGGADLLALSLENLSTYAR